jgi:hypothetical protein
MDYRALYPRRQNLSVTVMRIVETRSKFKFKIQLTCYILDSKGKKMIELIMNKCTNYFVLAKLILCYTSCRIKLT